MTSFKRTQRKYVQKAYRVRNWGLSGFPNAIFGPLGVFRG